MSSTPSPASVFSPTVGADVLVSSKYRATVRYVGPTDFAEGMWLGLELEKPIGKHDGTVLNRTYFFAAPKHGTFVRAADVSPFDPAVLAAAQIQAAQRTAASKKRVASEVLTSAFNRLDADAEARQLLRQQRLLATPLGKALSRERPTGEMVDGWDAEAASKPVESSYTGPRVVFPLTSAAVVDLMKFFRSGGVLHYRYALSIVAAFRRWSAGLPTLVEHAVGTGENVTVVGDTHGQLKDLLHLFHLNGLPTKTNRYIFNGDFVDRGENSVEVMLTVMAWCLVTQGAAMNGRLHGSTCFAQRGNHESHSQNLAGGFMSEVFQKYGARDDGDSLSDAPLELRLYDAFQAAFDAMPLASTIVPATAVAPTALTKAPTSRIFIVHGGLFHKEGITLANIAAVNRKRDIPFGHPGFEDKIFEDLMWSDPRTSPDGTSESDRGAGVVFGPDVTARFCALNGVSLVVRSHECMPEGALFCHNGRLVTVFSASMYCGKTLNKGAVLRFNSKLEHIVTSWEAPNLADCTIAGDGPADGNRPRTDSDSKLASEAVNRMLIERIIIHKADLYYYFTGLTASSTSSGAPVDGTVSKAQWAEGMRTVLKLDIPWFNLCSSLTTIQDDGRINFTRFLDRYRIAMRTTDLVWMEAITDAIAAKLFSAFRTLEESFRRFDEDDSGSITLDELERGLEKLKLGLSKSQLFEIMRSLDTNCDGRVTFDEFVARFRFTFERAAALTHAPLGAAALPPAPLRDAWLSDALHSIGLALAKAGAAGAGAAESAAQAFGVGDTNRDGVLSVAEFATLLGKIGVTFSAEQLAKIYRYVDVKGHNYVNLADFVAAFKVEDTRSNVGDITSWSAAGTIDGMATSAAAERALATVPAHSTFGGPKTPSWQRSVVEQIISVLYEYRVELAAAFSVFDINHDGRISREEFLAGLSALTELAGTAITPSQAEELLKALDKDGDGEISFTEFVEGFRLVDTGPTTDVAHASATASSAAAGAGVSSGGGASARPTSIHAPQAHASAAAPRAIEPPRLGVQTTASSLFAKTPHASAGGATPATKKV